MKNKLTLFLPYNLIVNRIGNNYTHCCVLSKNKTDEKLLFDVNLVMNRIYTNK